MNCLFCKNSVLKSSGKEELECKLKGHFCRNLGHLEYEGVEITGQDLDKNAVICGHFCKPVRNL